MTLIPANLLKNKLFSFQTLMNYTVNKYTPKLIQPRFIFQTGYLIKNTKGIKDLETQEHKNNQERN